MKSKLDKQMALLPLVKGVCIWAFTFFFLTASVWADSYFNSSEPGCDGSDPDMLLCDDFEDGTWYNKVIPDTDGWSLPDYNPPDNATCGNVGAHGTNCAADMGYHSGGGQWGDHGLKSTTDELWLRMYVWKSPGYFFGNEKLLILSNTSGQVIRVSASYFSSGKSIFIWGGAVYAQNQGKAFDCDCCLGSWILFEMHFVNNSGDNVPDGLAEVWIDDCGPDGKSCPATQTLRLRYTNVDFQQNGATGPFSSVKTEHWANPGTGESMGRTRFDQLIVSRTGPIGPMGSTIAKGMEQRCQELGNNCVCSEPFNTSDLVKVGVSYYNPDDSTTKECTLEGGQGSSVVRNSDDLIQSNDAASLAALPPGNQVSFFLRGPDNHAGIFMAGSRSDIGARFVKRGAMRYYIYHTPDFEFKGDGACTNSKMTEFDGGLRLDKGVGDVGMYNFLNFTPSQDCCSPGIGPDRGPGKQGWRGKWWRVETIFRNREGGDPGFIAEVYIKNVTDDTPEIMVVDTDLQGTQLIWSPTRQPPVRMDKFLINNYRQGTCQGWEGISHYMVAGWDTDQGQRIGPAQEIEGSGSVPPQDSVPPVAPRGLRVK